MNKKMNKNTAKKIYKARVGAPFRNNDAQPIGEFIERNNGKTPEEILDIIKSNKSHVIHSYIEWNDSKASELYRIQQVKNIINHITIEVVGVENGLPVRAFYSVQEEPELRGNVYVNVDSVFSTSYYKDQIISRALTELRNWTERYRQYNELSDLIKIIEEKLKKK